MERQLKMNSREFGNSKKEPYIYIIHTYIVRILHGILLHSEQKEREEKATTVDTNRNTNWFEYLVESFILWLYLLN